MTARSATLFVCLVQPDGLQREAFELFGGTVQETVFGDSAIEDVTLLSQEHLSIWDCISDGDFVRLVKGSVNWLSPAAAAKQERHQLQVRVSQSLSQGKVVLVRLDSRAIGPSLFESKLETLLPRNAPLDVQGVSLLRGPTLGY